MAQMTIPIAKPSLTRKEKKSMEHAFDSGYISASGDYITQFEEAFNGYLGIKHSISCNNGTSALHLALASLGIGRENEVIIPALTFIATKNAVLYQKAVPIVVDVDPNTLNIDVERVEAMINRRTKAIIAVHLYGNPCDMQKLVDICTKHRIHLIEDCAESFGSTYMKKNCGTFGTVSCFSFYGNKTITTGQGGMVCTNSEPLANHARHLKNQGMVYPYRHEELGFNYRMTNLEAAIGLAQMKRADDIIDMKMRITEYYRRHINTG
jgi:perosamine synthetase